jgi:hypothetical protein
LRSPLASGLVQQERPRGPRWWLRPPRSRHQAVLVRLPSGICQPEAEAEAEAWAESEVPGPPEPRQQQQQSHISHIQRQSRIQIQIQSSPSSLRGRIHWGHRFHDALAALGRRPQQVTLHQRPSVALDRGREEVTSHRSLAGPPQQQQQQLVEPRPKRPSAQCSGWTLSCVGSQVCYSRT